MANTTAFGWDTPDDTDLVKDGAAAIRELGQDIDTSMADLLGGTTGQVLAKASNTNMDFTWVAQDDSNAIQNAIVDAKGDLIAATAADTPARLAVGTNGQVLTVDSAESTGMKWAAVSGGGMTLLSTTTLSGSATAITISDSSYKALKIYIEDSNMSATNHMTFRLNNDTTSNAHYQASPYQKVVTGNGVYNNYGTSVYFTYYYVSSGDSNNFAWVEIPNYASSLRKSGTQYFAYNAEGQACIQGGQWGWIGTDPITRIDILALSGTFSGGTVKVYGES